MMARIMMMVTKLSNEIKMKKNFCMPCSDVTLPLGRSLYDKSRSTIIIKHRGFRN